MEKPNTLSSQQAQLTEDDLRDYIVKTEGVRRFFILGKPNVRHLLIPGKPDESSLSVMFDDETIRIYSPCLVGGERTFMSRLFEDYLEELRIG